MDVPPLDVPPGQTAPGYAIDGRSQESIGGWTNFSIFVFICKLIKF